MTDFLGAINATRPRDFQGAIDAASPRYDVLTYLRACPDRCGQCGFHEPTQGHRATCTVTPVAPTDEWSIFVAAVKKVAVDGVVHQSAVRPLIRGKVAPKSIGQFYRRAKDRNLLVDTGEREPSNDVAGRNTDKLDRIYRLGAAA